jgi:small subunit ribosomal protein S4
MIKDYTKKCRLCRAAGVKLFLKGQRCMTKCPIDKKGPVPPGQHGAKRRRKLSDYGIRLAEKQKLRRTYLTNENTLKKYFLQAKKLKGAATGEVLLQTLESRLDNVVYRLGLSPSRRFSRQLVSHKHVLVDGKIVNIPSFRIKPGSVVNLDSRAMNMTEVKALLGKKDVAVTPWMERKGPVGKFARFPKREEIETNISEQLVVEHYSR